MGDGTVGFGVLGSGNMARVYADALRTQVTGARLVAVALGSRAAAYGAAHGAAVEPDAAALLARPDVDVVVITTPHSTHRDLALAAAAAGKHVYLEKPMARTSAECDEIAAACRRAGVALTVAKQTRHMQTAMRAKELIDAGVIGEVRIIRALSPFTDFGLPVDHWLTDPNEGDCFLDWGAHACDAFRWFTGSEAVRVYADYANFGGILASSPTALVQARMDSGAICQAFLSYELPEPGLGSGSNNQYLIIGATGMIEWDLDTVRVARDGAWGTDLALESWTQPTWDPRHPRRIGNTARQVQGFVDALHAGTPPPIGGEDGRAAIAMTEAASRSAAAGAAVAPEAPPA